MKKTIIFIILLVSITVLFGSCALADDWVCPNCGRINDEDMYFCGKCRTEKPTIHYSVTSDYMNAWVCSACNHICPDTDTFCTQCGTDHYATDSKALLFNKPDTYDIDMPPCSIQRIPFTTGITGDVSYTANISGEHYFWIEGQESSFHGGLLIIDDKGNEDFTGPYDNSPSRLLTLSAGEKCRVRVTEYDKKNAAVTLCIGESHEVTFLNGTDSIQVIHDSMDFHYQENEYFLVPEVTGQYRVEISEMKSGQTVRLKIQDELGYVVAETSGSMGDGITFNAKAGNYYIIVKEISGFGEYKLTIQGNNLNKTADGCSAIGDYISFPWQDNCYSFKASQTGQYFFSLAGVKSGCDFKIEIIDSLGYTVYEGREFSVTLNAGDTYEIHVKQRSGAGYYSLFIQYP